MEGLSIKKDGIYVDCTAGGGGHSSGIVERLGDNGKLISLDKDDEALAACEKRREQMGAGNKWVLVKTDFSRIGAEPSDEICIYQMGRDALELCTKKYYDELNESQEQESIDLDGYEITGL